MTSLSRCSRASRNTGRGHRDLIVFLDALKVRCRLPFAELARRTAELETTTTPRVSASTLKRAVNPRALPSEQAVTAYARACGATAEEERKALALWRTARAEDRGILPTLRAPAVDNIRTWADLAAALAAAYERAGAPPVRMLQARATTGEAEGRLLLPTTTAWRMTRRQGRPTWPQCEAFLRACGVHPRRMRSWHDAWKRAQAPDNTDNVPAANGSSRGRTSRHLPLPPLPPTLPRRATDMPTDADPEPQDVAGLAAGLKVFALAVNQMSVRPDKVTPGVATALTALSQTLGREAHLNGKSLPENLAAGLKPLVTALPHLLPASSHPHRQGAAPSPSASAS